MAALTGVCFDMFSTADQVVPTDYLRITHCGCSSAVYCLRYCYQMFAGITMATRVKLAGLKWSDPTAYESLLGKECVQRRCLLVPKLMGGFLRIKVVNDEEEARLHGTPGSAGEKLEKVRYMKRRYTFGYEPRDLTAGNSYGVMVSSWGVDELVTKLELTYEFATCMIHVFGEGYGSRTGAKTGGSMNVFLSIDGKGRGSTRPHLTVTGAAEEVAQQQYHNNQFGNDLMHGEASRKVHTLTLSLTPSFGWRTVAGPFRPNCWTARIVIAPSAS